MAKKEFIYSSDEKEIRKYNVFQGKQNAAHSRGTNLILTNKRVILKIYEKGMFKNSNIVREMNINDVSGIHTSIDKKVNVLKILMFIFFGMIFMLLSGDFEGFLSTLFVLLGIAMIGLIVLMFVFPDTKGTIIVYKHGMETTSLSVFGGRIFKTTNISTYILDIVAGRDFDLLQSEIGSIINDLKAGKEVKPITKSTKIYYDEFDEEDDKNTKKVSRHYINEDNEKSTKKINKYQQIEEDEDDEIPLI